MARFGLGRKLGGGQGREWSGGQRAIAIAIDWAGDWAGGWRAAGLLPIVGLLMPAGLALAEPQSEIHNLHRYHHRAASSELFLMAQAGRSSPRPFTKATPQPPGRGSYVPPDEAAGRGGCTGDQRIAVMVPSTQRDLENRFEQKDTGGYTTESQPSLWIYTPYSPEELNSTPTIDLFVHQAIVNKDGQRTAGEVLETKKVAYPSKAGLMQLSLPESVTLAEGQGVYWKIQVKVKCPEKRPRTETATAWIERVPTPAALNKLGEDATLLEQAQVLHQADIWYDALARMMQLRSEPTANRADELEIMAQWNSFLESYAMKVGLEMPSDEGLADRKSGSQ